MKKIIFIMVALFTVALVSCNTKGNEVVTETVEETTDSITPDSTLVEVDSVE